MGSATKQRALFAPLEQQRAIVPYAAPAEDRPRLAGQNAAIVEMLRERPRTNVELAAVAIRYNARLNDIRRAGYRVVAERVEGGTWIYKLIE